jgi:anti-sigma regulatory factor (Ser/Thr protein kinase)/nucleoid DNA-binding protein
MRELSGAELAKALAESSGRDEAKGRDFVEAFEDAVRAAIADRRKVELVGLGVLVPMIQEGEPSGTTGSAELRSALCAKLSISEEEASATLSELLAVIRRSLVGGEAVHVAGLVFLFTQRDKAKIVKDPLKGHKIVSPPKNKLCIVPMGDARAAFEPDQALRDAIETGRNATIVIALPAMDFFAKILQYHFESAGWKVHACTSAIDALQAVDSQMTHMIIADASLKNYQKLCEAIKGRRETSLIPLLLIFRKGTNLDSPSEFMVCGDEHFVEPFEVKKLLSIADSELIRSSEEQAIFEQQMSFQFPTDDSNLERANDLGRRLYESSGLAEEDQVALAAAVREALGNAAQHGNRYRKDRKIEILYLLDKERITVVIKDAGKGFDHHKYVNRGRGGDALTAARERHKEGKLGGLGIMLMLKCTDSLEYSDLGNAVTVTRRLPRSAKRAHSLHRPLMPDSAAHI